MEKTIHLEAENIHGHCQKQLYYRISYRNTLIQQFIYLIQTKMAACPGCDVGCHPWWSWLRSIALELLGCMIKQILKYPNPCPCFCWSYKFDMSNNYHCMGPCSISVQFVIELYCGDRFVNHTVKMCIYSSIDYVLDFFFFLPLNNDLSPWASHKL